MNGIAVKCVVALSKSVISTQSTPVSVVRTCLVRSSYLFSKTVWNQPFWPAFMISTVEPDDSKPIDSKLLALVNFLPLINSFIA